MQKTPPDGWDLVGANVASRRETLQQIGDYDPLLGPATQFPSGEDTDYKLRLERAEIRMAATPRAIVHHTYGYRYGLRAVLKMARSYAYGNAGLAGKLTLMGDPRGKEWMQATQTECLNDIIKHPKRIPAALYRLWNAQNAYRFCLKNYKTEDGYLMPL